jgi:hypothetical protein
MSSLADADRRARTDEREALGLCRYCGSSTHKVDTCPKVKYKEAMKAQGKV